MSNPTIIDIADALGITPSTVSRALAGNSNVKESTRKAVQQKAKELGYERNVIASGFRKGVTNTIGIVVPRINREFFSSIISSAESVLEGSGYSVLICQTHERLEDEQRALHTLAASRVAGIMISHSPETLDGKGIEEALGGGKIKLVQFDRVFDGLPGSKVVNDDFNGAYSATKHLIEGGYKHIGALIGYNSCLSFVNRFEGYKAALVDAGMKVDEKIVFPNTIVRENGYSCTAKALELGCDAIYSSGDFSALGALECAIDHGLRVPQDFGVVGTANERFTALTSPSISSIDQYASEIGITSAREMLRLLEGAHGREIVVGTSLVARSSSAGKEK